jgi:hypothetical protein
VQLYKQHFAADHADEDEDDADGSPDADDDGKDGRKRQVLHLSCSHPSAACLSGSHGTRACSCSACSGQAQRWQMLSGAEGRKHDEAMPSAAAAAQKLNGAQELVMNRRRREGSDGDISSLSDGRRAHTCVQLLHLCPTACMRTVSNPRAGMQAHRFISGPTPFGSYIVCSPARVLKVRMLRGAASWRRARART